MSQSRTANDIVQLFINGRSLKWEERASDLWVRSCKQTSIRLTRKQWKWLLDVWHRENNIWDEDNIGGVLKNGIVWDASYTGYYHKNRNGTAKLTLRQYEVEPS